MMIGKNRYALNIPILYLYSFFNNLIFAFIIEKLFAQERGLSIPQMVYLEIIYAVVVVALEAPSGVIADIWGRKKVIVIASVFGFLEFFILIFAYNFWMFVLSVLAAALSNAASSGCVNALIYDSLKMERKQQRFETVLGRYRLFENLGVIIAAICGGVIASLTFLTFNYWISLISVGVCLILSFFLTEPQLQTQNPRHNFTKLFKKAFLYIKDQKSLLFVMLLGVRVGSLWLYVDEFWQLFMKEQHFPLKLFGFFFVGCSLLSGLGGLTAARIKKHLDYRSLFSLLLIVFTLSLNLLPVLTPYLAIPCFFLIYLSYGILDPLYYGYVHHHVGSELRATVESLANLLLKGVSIVVGLAFGFLSARFSVLGGFRLLGILAAVYVGFYLVAQFRFLKQE